jgi:hypothetical protein
MEAKMTDLESRVKFLEKTTRNLDLTLQALMDYLKVYESSSSPRIVIQPCTRPKKPWWNRRLKWE